MFDFCAFFPLLLKFTISFWKEGNRIDKTHKVHQHFWIYSFRLLDGTYQECSVHGYRDLYGRVNHHPSLRKSLKTSGLILVFLLAVHHMIQYVWIGESSQKNDDC